MTKSRKSLPLKRGAVHGGTRQVPLVELVRLFATESVAVRLSVLLCALGGEIILNALMCLMRLSLVAMVLFATSEGMKHGVLALL
ncbi:hypothetical protein AYM40_16140 [Paraburkholderia phytofirmans OLGA172]|uniref:Uncharacterized protein n=1 Tax=Paraburkholderia phytofirmans OLGA172 TaxID=1417228 RepID=A0A160FMN7_9BURK|nr:hypothetical protein AYM40_16140 [Paraburkholderia phytofirmans OLGA172]